MFLDPGICQALEVEVVEDGFLDHAGDNVSKPKFPRVRLV